MINKSGRNLKLFCLSLLVFGFLGFFGATTWAGFAGKSVITGNYLQTVYPCPDFNGDNLVNLSDFAYFGQYYNHTNLEEGYNFFADFNWDGRVDEVDFAIFSYYYNGPYVCGPDPMAPFQKTCPDYNGDGKINLVDFAFFSQYYGRKDPLADLNQDGVVDKKDKIIFEWYYQGKLVCAEKY